MLLAIVIGLGAGVVGTGIGGLIAIFFKNANNSMFAFLLNFAGGIMLALVCFELIPSSLESSNILLCLTSLFAGIFIIMFFGDVINFSIEKKLKNFAPIKKDETTKKGFLRMGIVLFFAIALHNFPEGLVVGSSQTVDNPSFVVALLIALHDIPEGLAMAVPLKASGFSNLKVILLCLLSGVPTVLGSVIGFAVGGINEFVLASCYALASGAMLFVTFSEIFPKAIKLSDGKMQPFGVFVGLACGFAFCSF